MALLDSKLVLTRVSSITIHNKGNMSGYRSSGEDFEHEIPGFSGGFVS
jgi:hypothetical protein